MNLNKYQIKTLSKVKNQLQQIIDEEWEEETAHVVADELLCELLNELGFKDVTELFNKIDKWYA